MTPSPGDTERLLHELRSLGTTSSPRFAGVLRLISRQLRCPMAWLGLMDEDGHLWLLAELGLAQREVPPGGDGLMQSLFSHETATLESSQAAARIAVDGRTVGLACAMSPQPRAFDADALASLLDLAQLAGSLLESALKEQQWRLQEERVRTAGLSSNDWLWESDADRHITWVSSGVEALTGRPAATQVGLSMAQINRPSPHDHTGSWKRYEEARARHQPFRDFIADRDTPAGVITVTISGTPVFDADGCFSGYRGATSNITARVQVERSAKLALAEQQQQLRESQAQLSAVLGAVPDLWFVLDANGRYLKCSSDQHPMLVVPWDSVRGQPFEDGVPKALADRVTAAITRALSSGEVQRLDYDLITADGVARVFEARISPMPNQQVLYVTRDLTQFRGLERDLLIMQRALEAEASLPISVVDATLPDMPLIYVNPAFEHLTGYSRSEALGRNCRFLQGHLTGQAASGILRDAMREGRSVSVTLNNVRKDGSVFSNALHVAPVRDATGQLTHYIGVQRDVTEQSLAADKLRLSEELYRSVASAISDGLLVVTPDFTIIAVNPAGCEILGVAHGDLVGQSGAWPFALLDSEAASLSADGNPVEVVANSDRPLMNQTHALRRPDGQLRWVALNAHPLRLRPDGRTFSVVLTFRDITQQRAAEQALAAAEERWKFALEGSGDGVWDWDALANKFYYSARWKSMRGYAEHEITDSADEWKSRVHPDDMPRVRAEIGRHLRGEVPSYEVDYRVRHRLGHDIWIRDRGKAVSYGPDGKALRMVGMQSDITRARQDEQMLRDKQAAELASQAKSEFLSRMSHEMRTPLNAVIGFSQLLGLSQNALDANTVREYAGHVLGAGEHLLALIDDVLDLQKIEEGALTLKLGTVDLHEAVSRAMELLRPTAGARQVRLDNQVAPGVWVHADRQRLRQVLLNVASNGIKYNHPGGGVRWRLEEPAPGRVTLCVEDNGAGMSAEQMSRLFQPFERLGRETSTIEGTGLGLIIARSLTQAIGGRLSVASEAGRGTCVRIELQRAEASLGTSVKLAASDALAASPSLRMLYVEDNRINAILFEEAIRMHSSQIELRVAEDGDQALTLAQGWQPEVLVLDAHLPGISGFEVLRLLRGLPGLDKVPAYMCSADAMPEDVQRAYDAGFIGYWTKPIDVNAVMADIDQCLQRARSTAVNTTPG